MCVVSIYISCDVFGYGAQVSEMNGFMLAVFYWEFHDNIKI